MTIRDQRRQAALERMADHLLREGMEGASLRPLAQAAGTSDRMLLYYFAGKDEVLTATLGVIAIRLGLALDAAIPATPRLPPAALLGAVWQAISGETVRPFMRLWFDLLAGAAHGRPLEGNVARIIAAYFHDWVESRIAPDPARPDAASLVFAMIEARLMLDAAGQDAIGARAAASLAAMLSQDPSRSK